MILDLGCPNSVIGIKDKETFIQNLSQFQQKHISIVKTKEKFKFGPSGPYSCHEKLRFPIQDGSKLIWVKIALVQAQIPMLLGNNILKPLGAEMKLFREGNGVLRLRDKNITMKETSGGHYTVRVADLAKLCETWHSESDAMNKCDECDKTCEERARLENHMDAEHEGVLNFHASALKKSSIQVDDNPNICFNRIFTDLNTLINGTKRPKDKKMIETMRSVATICQQNFKKSCDCDECGNTIHKQDDLQNHVDSDHIASSTSSTVDNHTEMIINTPCDCDNCGRSFMKKRDLKNHASSHDEDFDEMVEFDETLWDVLLSDNESNELTSTEKKEIHKLHKYFAHRNGRKLWENIFLPAGKLKGKKKLVLGLLDNCETCQKYRKTPPRPKVGMPKARDFNDVVSLDLKIFKKDGKKEIGILYIHDEFTKLIKGQVINDKNKETIIKGIESKWLIGDGAGPGHPSRGYFSDNGGEFLNDELIDFAAASDITIRMTAASSPWMNGSCERNHATVDRIIEKILEDEPKTGLQKAVDLACFVKNSEINKTGFSPLQLYCGKSPTYPGLSDCTPTSVELDGNNDYLKILRRIDNARIESRRVDCNQRMKVALKSKINTSCMRSYQFGDKIYFKLDSAHKWKSGLVLGMDGKVVFVRYGNFIRRVPIDRVVPGESFEENAEEEIDPDDVENEERLEDDAFDNVELISKKDKEIETLKQCNSEQEKLIAEISGKLKKKQEEETTTIPDKLKNDQKQAISLPKLWQKITFQLDGNPNLLRGKVINKHKPNSRNKGLVIIKMEDGSTQEFNFATDVTEWLDAQNDMNDVPTSDTFATTLTKAQVANRPDACEAIQQEIKKFEDFSAFKTVKDVGQNAIKTRWVFTDHEDESKGYRLKARLCIRGDTEENLDNVRADSPTAQKDSLKLALAIAANEEFGIMSADITSAFLQGKTLEREVFVIPPVEAKREGELWLLQKGAYGLIDGSRLFYLQLKEKLEELGFKPVSGDSALFTFHKDGKLRGLVCLHVDDLLLLGRDSFMDLVQQKLFKLFKFSKVEKDKFKYLGCEIEKHENGDISVHQTEYINQIEEVVCPSRRNNSPVTESERKEIRRVVGSLLWVSLMSRPDISFEVNQLSTNISTATIGDLKTARRLVEKVKMEPVSLRFTKLGPFEKLRIKLYCDASFNNQDEKLRSTEGRVLLLENAESRKVNIFSWKTKKIVRVCRSVKGAETRALENGLDESIYFARMLHEIYVGKENLKSPKQIPVFAATDNKSLWENLNNSRQCDEKLLRNSIALIKEMIEQCEVKTVDWVPTTDMLADILTKRGGSAWWIKSVMEQNTL